MSRFCYRSILPALLLAACGDVDSTPFFESEPAASEGATWAADPSTQEDTEIAYYRHSEDAAGEVVTGHDADDAVRFRLTRTLDDRGERLDVSLAETRFTIRHRPLDDGESDRRGTSDTDLATGDRQDRPVTAISGEHDGHPFELHPGDDGGARLDYQGDLDEERLRLNLSRSGRILSEIADQVGGDGAAAWAYPVLVAVELWCIDQRYECYFEVDKLVQSCEQWCYSETNQCESERLQGVCRGDGQPLDCSTFQDVCVDLCREPEEAADQVCFDYCGLHLPDPSEWYRAYALSYYGVRGEPACCTADIEACRDAAQAEYDGCTDTVRWESGSCMSGPIMTLPSEWGPGGANDGARVCWGMVCAEFYSVTGTWDTDDGASGGFLTGGSGIPQPGGGDDSAGVGGGWECGNTAAFEYDFCLQALQDDLAACDSVCGY